MKLLTSIFIVALMFLSLSSFASDPIKDLINVTVPVNIDGSTPKLEAIKMAVISACRKRGWSPTITGDNEITAIFLLDPSTMLRLRYLIVIIVIL